MGRCDSIIRLGVGARKRGVSGVRYDPFCAIWTSYGI